MKAFVILVCFFFYLQGYTIDFQNSLQKTLQNNKGLKAKKLSIEEAKLSIEEAKGYSYGELVFQENISRTNNAGYVFGMKLASREASFGDFGFNEFDMTGATNPLPVEPKDLNYPESRTNFETKVVYKAPLFTGFKLQSGKKMAQLQLLAQQARYLYDEKTLSLEVLKAYNGAVAAREFVKAVQKAKNATNFFVKFASAMYEEGLVTNIDVKQAQVYDMEIESQKTEAYNRYELAIAYLRFLTDDETISEVGEFESVGMDHLIVAQITEELLQKRGDYQWMRYNTQTLESKIDFQSASKYPTIGIQVEYGYNDDSFGIKDIDEKDYYMGAVGLSYSLFDGGVSGKKAQKAKIQYNQILHNFEYMKDGMKLQIQNNLLTHQAKTKILTQKVKAQKLSEEVLEQSLQMYKNNLISMSELLVQQANQQKANAQTIMANYEKSLAAAQLQISLGESL